MGPGFFFCGVLEPPSPTFCGKSSRRRRGQYHSLPARHNFPLVTKLTSTLPEDILRGSYILYRQVGSQPLLSTAYEGLFLVLGQSLHASRLETVWGGFFLLPEGCLHHQRMLSRHPAIASPPLLGLPAG